MLSYPSCLNLPDDDRFTALCSLAGAASQAGDADSSRAPGLASGLQGSVNVHRGALLLCHSDSASVLLYFTLDILVLVRPLWRDSYRV